MSAWHLAASLQTLFEQINIAAPHRSKVSDGTIGDANHRNRTSDHNPHYRGSVVTAIDVTHDPKGGVDCAKLVDALVRSRDKRIKYIIYNRRIISATVRPWEWRPYTLSNPHTKHAHISVVAASRAEDATAWDLDGFAPPLRPGQRLLEVGDGGPDVKWLQATLGIASDGDFGPITHDAVKQFQHAHHLDVDGIVGPNTWRALTTAAKPQPPEAPPQQPEAKPQPPEAPQQQPEAPPQHSIPEWLRTPIPRTESVLGGATSAYAVIAGFDHAVEHITNRVDTATARIDGITTTLARVTNQLRTIAADRAELGAAVAETVEQRLNPDAAHADLVARLNAIAARLDILLKGHGNNG